MATKRKRFNSLDPSERMRLEAELRKYLVFEDEEAETNDEFSGIREDAPKEVKDYFERLKWEEEELTRSGVITD